MTAMTGMSGALVTFSLAALLIVLLPGPDTLVVVRNLVRGGRPTAALTVAGVLTGLTLWVIAAALGLSALLRASHDGYLALRVVGAAYLVWLGIGSLRSRTTSPGLAPVRRGLLGHGYGAGLATDLLNPKVGVFFVTFLPGFVPSGQPVGATSLLFGAIFVVETAVYFAVLLALAGRVTGWMDHPVVRRRLDRATGAVLIAFGARLATES
jgi:threonine/homoserine/homoserine lactone efflux protein